MTGIHVVPDRQQYIGLRQAHTLYRIDSNMIGTHQIHLAKADTIPGVSISYCKVEFQPFKRSYSQLTFFNFL